MTVRVLILHSRYLSGPVSGENRVVVDQTRLLQEAGHDVLTWTPSAERLPIIRAGMDTMWSEEAATRVRRFIREFRPDVMHVHNLFPMLSPAVLRTAGAVPIVMTLHNFRYMCLSGTLFRDGHTCQDCVGRVPWPGVLHGCYRGTSLASGALAVSLTLHRAIGSFRRVDMFIALSEFMRRRYELAGLPAERLVVQTNFSWPSERRTGSGRYFLYLGRLSSEKGLETLVRSWDEVEAPLTIVGEGPEEGRLRAEARGAVEFRGSVDAAEVPALLRDARALVVPSIWYEGAPRAIIEAYAAGVPVLASDLGALPEIVVEGETGHLLPPGGTDAWIDAARRMTEDDTSRRMGDAAYQRWRAVHDPARHLVSLEDLYGRVVGGRAGGVAPA